eukprot:COSAG02_NODE_175_length_31226_cov_95.275934_9_plen_138_part_00
MIVTFAMSTSVLHCSLHSTHHQLSATRIHETSYTVTTMCSHGVTVVVGGDNFSDSPKKDSTCVPPSVRSPTLNAHLPRSVPIAIKESVCDGRQSVTRILSEKVCSFAVSACFFGQVCSEFNSPYELRRIRYRLNIIT